MCKTRRHANAAAPQPKPTTSPTAPPSSSVAASSTTSSAGIHASFLLTTSYSSSTPASFIAANLRFSLSQGSDRFHLYSFAEILSATSNFLVPPISPSSNSWRCFLHGVDSVVSCRPFRGDPASLPAHITALCRSHHRCVAEFLGACLADDHVYLVYRYIAGASLAQCLRNPQNPSFTPLSSWLSRIQIATDLAQGLEYIHNHADIGTSDPRRFRWGTVHNRVKSSAVIIAEPFLQAKICHFGAADLAGEIPVDDIDWIGSDELMTADTKLGRTSSTRKKIEGTRGYMAPEVLAGGPVSRLSDVFAFGVVLLELLSGEEPLRYRLRGETGEIERTSVIETARVAMRLEGEEAADVRRGRIRRWVDGRLVDSFPVESAEEAMRVALRCVAEEAASRPEMVWVAGKLSKLLLQAKAWDEKVKAAPARYLTSVVPR